MSLPIRLHRPILIGLSLLLPVASMYFHGKPDRDTSLIEAALLRVTSPLQSGMRGMLGSVGESFDDYVVLTEVKERNAVLERDNQVLLGEALKSRALQEDPPVKPLCDFTS